MASIDVGIHPDAAGAGIRTRYFGKDQTSDQFSTLEFATDAGRVDIYVRNRNVLNAIQAALHEIETDMGRAEQAAMKAAQTASDEVPTVMADWPAGPPGEALGVFGK